MFKKSFIIIIALFLGVHVIAQENTSQSSWTKGGNVSLNLSQAYFSNWAAGGQNAINWLGTANYDINYANDNFKWNNSIALGLGYSYFDFDYKPVKTDDRIEITSLGALKATEHLNYSLEFALRTQFAKGYDYATDSSTAISKFLAPAYISLGLGMQWTPNKHFSLNFAPVTGRITIVNDQDLADKGAFGVQPAQELDGDTIPGKMTRMEFGARMTANLQYEIFKNVDFKTKVELFSNYLDHPERIDVDWQVLLVMKVNSWLNCNIATHLIYDYDVPFYDLNTDTGLMELDPNSKVQFKEVFSIGISVKL